MEGLERFTGDELTVRVREPRADPGRIQNDALGDCADYPVFGEREQREFEQSPWPIRIFDRETLKYLAVNDAAAVSLYGHTREEFLALGPLDTRHPDERARLRDAGYRVSSAANGEDALKIVEEDPPDLALLDVRMPGMNGIAIGRLLRERVPLLYLSAYGDDETVRDAIEQGAQGYLVKPLDIAQILPSLQAVLATSAEFRALRMKEEQLAAALAAGRVTATAVGVLVERHRIGRRQAIELLRAKARSRRRSVQVIAGELAEAYEKLNINNKL